MFQEVLLMGGKKKKKMIESLTIFLMVLNILKRGRTSDQFFKPEKKNDKISPSPLFLKRGNSSIEYNTKKNTSFIVMSFSQNID